MANLMTPQETHKGFRAIGATLIILAVAVTLLLIGVFGARFISSNFSKDKNTTGRQASTAGNVVVRQATVETDCYSFMIDRTTNFGTRSECNVEVTYGSDGRNRLVVKRTLPPEPVKSTAASTSTLDTYRDALSKNVTVESGDQVKLSDGSIGYKYIVRQPGEQQKQAILMVFSTRTVEQNGGKITPVFIINTPAETDEQKQVLQGIIDSWKWK